MQGCDNTKCFFQYPANCYRFVICYLCFHVLFFGVFLLENISNSISLSQSSTQVGVLVTVSVIVRETFHDGVARLPNTGFFFVRALFYVPFTLSIMFYYLRMSDIFWLFFFLLCIVSDKDFRTQYEILSEFFFTLSFPIVRQLFETKCFSCLVLFLDSVRVFFSRSLLSSFVEFLNSFHSGAIHAIAFFRRHF